MSENLDETHIDCGLSGSTLVTVTIIGNNISCANVGDSRAVMGSLINGIFVSKALTVDQKPDLQTEKDRILKKGGKVHPYIDDRGHSNGPSRVWLQTDDIPGLAMSRSIGDKVARRVGVIPDPGSFIK